MGVERLFNSARDICHFRRARLDPGTIQCTLIQLATDRFLVKEEYRRMVDEGEVEPTDDVDVLDEEEKEECLYISDKDDDSDEELDADDEPDAAAHHNGSPDDSIQVSRSRRGRREPGHYRALANGIN